MPEDMAEDDGVMLENIIRVPEDTKVKVGRREQQGFIMPIDEVMPEDVIRVTATMVEGR